MNVLICGIGGKMGKTVADILKDDKSATVVCGVDICKSACGVPVYGSFNEVEKEVDVIIDFSSPAALKDELLWAKTKHVPIVLGSTGFSAEQIKEVENCAKETPVFKTANFSLGVCLLKKLVACASATLGEDFDVEIIERHHRQKADAPSGTALALAESVNTGEPKPIIFGREGSSKRGREIAIHAVRGGTIVGEHEVMFAGDDEIITLSHSARSKKVFAAGAVRAAKWICGKPAGLYGMDDLLGDIF